MIAKKAKRSGGFGGRIDYIIEEQASKEQRGKYLNCSSDLSDCIPIGDKEGINGDKITAMMEAQASKNTRVLKACYHQIFSFPEGERPSDEVLSDISQEFAEEFGFTQWLSVKHEDTKKLHIHFVGNIVNNEGKVSVNDSNDYYRLNDFVKYMNEKHDLQRVGTIKDKGETLENKQIQRLQKIIDKAILTEGVKDIQSLQHQLIKVGVKSLTQRGITFIDKNSGVQFKGSKLGKGYSLGGIEKRIKEKDIQQETKIDPYHQLKTLIETVALQSKHLEDFGNKLDKYKIYTSSLNSQITFNLHGNQLNENQLGEDYSLKNIRFNFSKNSWTSRVNEKENLKILISQSISNTPDENLQSLENVFANLDKEGWKASTEKKQFTNTQNELVSYTQLSFKSKSGLLINDNDLKGKDTNTNPYGYSGILKEIEKVNQRKLKTETKKMQLSEMVKDAAVKANDTNGFLALLKIQNIDFILKEFQNTDTGETIETLRIKKNGAVYTSNELGEDLSLDNLRFNINTRSHSFITRNSLKTGLINDIQQTLNVEMIKDFLNIDQLNKALENKNWKVEVHEKYFKSSEGHFVPYSQFKYVSLDNEHKFVYDYELKERNEKNNDFSAKNVNNLLDKNKAVLVRNSLINCLDNSRSYQELAYQMYCDSGIVMDRVNRTFETKGSSINYKECVFYIPTEKQHSISREEFNQNWRKLIENAETGKREKMSLSDINKVSNGSQITNIDIADILTQNAGSTINKANEMFNNEFGPEQRDTFLEDLKKIVLGKVTQSGHAHVKGSKEQDDIRSKEEKRKDELRRQGRKM